MSTIYAHVYAAASIPYRPPTPVGGAAYGHADAPSQGDGGAILAAQPSQALRPSFSRFGPVRFSTTVAAS